MFLQRFLPVLFCIILFAGHAQDTSGYSRTYYPNGKVLTEKVRTDSAAFFISTYYPNGRIKKTENISKGKTVGESISYNKYGKTESILFYQEGKENYTFKNFRKDGTIKNSGAIRNSKKFGEYQRFDERGNVTEVQDFNKGKQVQLDNTFLFGKHFNSSAFGNRLSVQSLTLQNVHKDRKKLKPGAFIHITSYNETFDHCLVEGYLKDTIILTKFSYDLSSNKKTLKLDSTFLLPIQEIKDVTILRKYSSVKSIGAAVLIVAGTIMIVESLIISPSVSGPLVFYDLSTYAIAGAGVASFAIGVQLITKPMTKKYFVVK